MTAQATELSPAKRKTLFDRVQEIVQEQAPFLYLVNKNVLSAVSPALRRVQPAVLHPEILWDVDELQLAGPQMAARSSR
jgi:ABC-type transport system substrate-binding protein